MKKETVWDCTYNVTPPYETWIAQWTSHLAGLPDTVMVMLPQQPQPQHRYTPMNDKP